MRSSIRTTRSREYASLKQTTLSALTKLNDRDTLKTALDELNRIVEDLDSDGLPIFLSCLYDCTDDSHKPNVRREVIKTFSTVIKVHPNLVGPSLSKLFARTVKQLKDQDSSLRDAAAETIGCIVSNMQGNASTGPDEEEENTSSASSTTQSLGLQSIYRQLFALFNEQNKHQQSGAASAIRKAIQNSETRVYVDLPMLSPKLVKLISQTSCQARPQVLMAAAALIDTAGEQIVPYLNSLVGSFVECLGSDEWALRKAAVEGLGTCALRLPSQIQEYHSVILSALDGVRFDKIKPVRDAVSETIQIYRSSAEDLQTSPISPANRGISPRVSQPHQAIVPPLEFSRLNMSSETTSPKGTTFQADSSSVQSMSRSPISPWPTKSEGELERIHSQLARIISQQSIFSENIEDLRQYIQSSLNIFDRRLQHLEERVDSIAKDRTSVPQLLHEQSTEVGAQITPKHLPVLVANSNTLRGPSVAKQVELASAHQPLVITLDSQVASAVQTEDFAQLSSFFSQPDFSLSSLTTETGTLLLRQMIAWLRDGKQPEMITPWVRRFIESRYPLAAEEKTELTKIYRQYSLLSTPQGVEATRVYALLLRYSFDSAAKSSSS
eukprot:TRINITY_DN100_c0_g4_i1.p1 TRINITY_DN100_c0_g4~~TRINITY_DN100_c0_g4_i1.p1  ORF type:complete len:610 (-),score=111.95 TRINITY_DN100_c0_g4_i1:1079-2908(-)